jgi:hypothetical protein
MASASARSICLFVSVIFAVGVGVGSAAQGKTSGTPRVPKLCMPVSYRERSSNVLIKTRIGMLADRYREVSEALSGWNQTGVPLIGRANGRWEPVPCGDDTGLFYMVPLLARSTGWSADRSLDLFLFGIIAVSSAIGLVGLWLTTSAIWGKMLAVVPIGAGAYLACKLGDVYVVQSSVVLMLIPWLVYALDAGVKRPIRFFIVFASGLALGLAQWIRTQSASPVLVFFAVLLCLSSVRRSLRIQLLAALLAGMSLPLLYAPLPPRERDRFLALHQPGYQGSLNHHLFWHTAYVGLSYLKNPYVPVWRDFVATDYVQTVDPDAIYGGKRYESILRSRVMEIARRDPRFILYTVAAKLGVLAGLLLISTNLGLAASIKCPKPQGIEWAFWISVLFAALPGIIAIPAPQYVLGMISLALCYWYYSLSFYMERCWHTGRRTVPGAHAPRPHALQLDALLLSYPRSRPELPPRQQASYVEHYQSNRAAKQGLSRIVGTLESWMHRVVSEGVLGGNLLEIGAGNLNHIPYLPSGCVCDAVEPFNDLWRGSQYRSRIRNIYSDLQEVSLTSRYDYILSVAVLEHLTDLPWILARSGLLLSEGGTFRAAFPSEGGLMWGLAWRLTTGIEYRLRRGLDYGALMRHEHLNTAREILMLLGYFYQHVEISRFPLPHDHLSFYTVAIARQPRLARCLAFQASRSERGTLAHE